MKIINIGGSMSNQQFGRALKFALVGIAGLLVDFTVTWMMKEVLYVNAYLANALGFVLAASGNFYLNKKWTFNDNNKKFFKQYFTFFLVALFGLLLHSTLLYVFYGHWGISFYGGKLLAVAVVFFWNFLANSFFTFKDRGHHGFAGYSTPHHYKQIDNATTCTGHKPD